MIMESWNISEWRFRNLKEVNDQIDELMKVPDKFLKITITSDSKSDCWLVRVEEKVK
jgi:hypothetical protein